jgi:hypothetical protein
MSAVTEKTRIPTDKISLLTPLDSPTRLRSAQTPWEILPQLAAMFIPRTPVFPRGRAGPASSTNTLGGDCCTWSPLTNKTIPGLERLFLGLASILIFWCTLNYYPERANGSWHRLYGYVLTNNDKQCKCHTVLSSAGVGVISKLKLRRHHFQIIVIRSSQVQWHCWDAVIVGFCFSRDVVSLNK